MMLQARKGKGIITASLGSASLLSSRMQQQSCSDAIVLIRESRKADPRDSRIVRQRSHVGRIAGARNDGLPSFLPSSLASRVACY